jgi:hypothetical protein
MGGEKLSVVGKPEGKRPLGRIMSIWEDNIKIDHKYIGWVVVWLDLSGSGCGPVAGHCNHGSEP